jgi:outer membrane protein TolC
MKYAALVCSFMSVANAHAEPERLALRDAVQLAVERNPGLIVKTIDAERAADGVTSARGAQDFVAASSVRWDGTRTRDDNTSSDAVVGTTSLTRPLPGGGSIALVGDATFTRDRAATLAASSTASLDHVSSQVVLVLRQPVLRVWGDTAPDTVLSRAEAVRDIAYLERAAAAAVLLHDVVAAYWEASFARDVLAIRRLSLALAREQLRVTRARVSSGRIAESEVLAVGQTIALREDEVAQAETALVTRSIELAELLGREVHEPILFDPSDMPRASAPRDLARELALARARSPELATVRARGKAAEIEVEVTSRGLLPSLDLEASGGIRGEGDRAGSAWAELRHARTAVYAVGLELTVPLGNHAARGARATAVRARRRAKVDEQALATQIESAVVTAMTVIEAARRRIATLEQALDMADEAIKAERVRWEVGRSTNYDVMRRQAEREDTALRLARARTDLVTAEAKLDAVTGAILERHDVALAR